jgi:tetratricopeptide (TPR) repeat protein
MMLSGRNGRWLLAVLAVSVALAGCGGAESRKAKHFEKGKSYLAEGNYEKARVEFRNALQIVPTDSDVRFQNGVVEEKLGKAQAAAGYYQAALETNADNLPARTALARLYLFAGQPKLALDALGPGLQKHPDDPELLAIRAGVLVQNKDLAGARKDAERAVQLAPTNDDAIGVLAGIDRAENQTDAAEKLLRDALARSPASVDLRLVLAQIESSLGKNAEVEALLLELVKLKPEEKAHRLRLAQFYARAGQLDEAEKVLRDGVKALPREAVMKTALVDFLANRRSLEVAEKELKDFVAAAPDDYELKFELAQFYTRGNDSPKAEAIYQQVIEAAKLTAPGLTARDRYAALLIQKNDVKGAKKLIGEVLAESPRDDDALILRGNLELAEKDPKSAIADLRSVLRDQPNSVGVMRSLARAHLANGESALAEETLRRAMEGNPADATVRLELAQLLAQLGKPEQAKPIIDELVKQHPDDLKALDSQFKIAMNTRDLVTAKAAANAILAAQPKAGAGEFYLGAIADAEKRNEDAIREYDAALQVQPTALEPLEALIRDLVFLKRSPEALKRLDAMIAANPKAPLPLNLKGDVLFSVQRTPEAIAAFRAALELQPTWWVPYRNIARAQLTSHDDEGAIATLKAGIEHASDYQQLVVDLAGLQERAGRIDDAAATYEAALKRDPQSDVDANNLAMLLVTYRKDQPSLDRAKALVTRFAQSQDPNFLDTYGWVMFKRGDAAAAVPALRDALARTPQSPVSQYHLGMAQALAGQNDAARDNLSHSLQSGQKFPGMDEAKATLERLASQVTTIAAPPKS